jgi:hypothetical protein
MTNEMPVLAPLSDSGSDLPPVLPTTKRSSLSLVANIDHGQRVRKLSSAFEVPVFGGERRASFSRARATSRAMVEKRTWEYSDDDEDALIIHVSPECWEIGFAGEDAPRVQESTKDWSTTLDLGPATQIVEKFLSDNCQGVVPQNLMFVLPLPYSKMGEWSRFAFEVIGFHGVITCDSRHMLFYASGKRTGLAVDVTDTHISCLACYEGFVIESAGVVTELAGGAATGGSSPFRAKFGKGASAQSPAGAAGAAGQNMTQLSAAILQCIDQLPLDIVKELCHNVYVAGGSLQHWAGLGREAIASSLLAELQAGKPHLDDIKVGGVAHSLTRSLTHSPRSLAHSLTRSHLSH